MKFSDVFSKKPSSSYTPAASLESVEKTHKDGYIFAGVVSFILIFFVMMVTSKYMSVHPRATLFESISPGLKEFSENPLYLFPLDYDFGIAFGLGILGPVIVLLDYFTTKFKLRTNRDQGHSAKWSDIANLRERYAEFDSEEGKKKASVQSAEKAYYNAIMSKNLYVSVDAEHHFHALNTLLIGASGTGKTRFWLKPNLLQMNSSFAITDPKGEILDSCGELLRRNGYDVKVFDVAFKAGKTHRCNTYNPLRYCKQESDIKKVVEAFITNTAPPGDGGGSKDPFWEDSMKTLLLAIIGLLCTVPEGYDKPYGMMEEITGGIRYEACFANVIEFVRKSGKKWDANCGIKMYKDAKVEESKTATASGSELGAMFENLKVFESERQDCEVYEIEKPYCLQEWEGIYKTPEKTFETIKTTCTTRLDPFNIQQVKNLTSSDNIALDEMGGRKTALFLIMEAADKTYNFLLSLMYTQLYASLYSFGEARIDGSKQVSIANGECIRWFSREELAENPNAPEEFVEKLKGSEYKKVPVGEGKSYTGKDKKTGKEVKFEDCLYEIRNSEGELITKRVTEDYAKEFVKDLSTASIKKCVMPKLPFHFRFLIDEFPNIGEIPEFKEKLATMRGYNISSTVICQSITQLKGMYEKDYEVIDANCPFVVFLGGDENSNNEYLAKKMGKTTVKNVDNSIAGEKDSVTASGKTEGVELMTQDEIGRIAFTKQLVFIYGEQVTFDDKVDVQDHKNFKLSKEYLQKCGIDAMNFDKDAEDYVIPEKVTIAFLPNVATAVPSVTMGDAEALTTALKKFLGVSDMKEAAKKASASIKRYSFEENSVPIAF